MGNLTFIYFHDTSKLFVLFILKFNVFIKILNTVEQLLLAIICHTETEMVHTCKWNICYMK